MTVDQNVRRLQIAMQRPLLVRVVDRFGHLTNVRIGSLPTRTPLAVEESAVCFNALQLWPTMGRTLRLLMCDTCVGEKRIFCRRLVSPNDVPTRQHCAVRLLDLERQHPPESRLADWLRLPEAHPAISTVANLFPNIDTFNARPINRNPLFDGINHAKFAKETYP